MSKQKYASHELKTKNCPRCGVQYFTNPITEQYHKTCTIKHINKYYKRKKDVR